jgi:N-methylhydantoinase B
MAAALDPTTLAVLKGRLEEIAAEMDATLVRAAFNPIISEAHDCAHGLYDAETGATLVQGKSGLPIFVGTMAFAVKAAIDRAAAEGDLGPGDIYAMNDPYDGGSHLNDVKLVQPVFRDGRLFCWLASVAHWLDMAGNVPGNYNPRATEVAQEGFLLPPVKLAHRGQLRPDILAVLAANTRLPQINRGDLEGQLAALRLGERRLQELLDDAGEATVAQVFAELRQRAARLMRAEIAALPDGGYSAEDQLDNDGNTPEPIIIALDLTVAGEALTLDFSRSSPACQGALNISRATAVASCYVALKHLFPEVIANAGVLDPVRVVLKDGSVLAAGHPRPTGGYTETTLRVIDVIFQAFAQAAPELARGCAYGTISALSIAGRRADGSRWVFFNFHGGGHGAHAGGDGLNHGNAPISMATMPPLEIVEATYPLIYRSWALRPDSGGAGARRGGLGAIYEMELLDQAAELTLFCDRGTKAPPGVAGGGPGALARYAYAQGGTWRTPALVTKEVGVKLAKGDRVRLETPGGGGWGEPAARAPALAERDRAEGYVSA